MASSSGCDHPDSSTFPQYESAARKPLRFQIRLKRPIDDRKTEEDVHITGGELDDVNEKKEEEEEEEEGTLVEECNSWRTSFKGLPTWSVTGRRGWKHEQYSTPTGGDKNMNLDHPLLELDCTSDNDSMNLDPPPDNNEAESSGSPAAPLNNNNNILLLQLEAPAAGSNGGDVGALGTTTEESHARSDSFSTHQEEALGGHGKRKPIAEQVGDQTYDPSDERNNNAQDDGQGKDPKPHKCRVCSKGFETGQKLGGHMRKHYKGTLSSKRVKRDGSSSSATARSEAPDHDSSSASSLKITKANSTSASLSEDTYTKKTAAAAAAAAAAGSVTNFDLNELPREVLGDQSPASFSSSSTEETPPHAAAAATASTLGLTLSLSINLFRP